MEATIKIKITPEQYYRTKLSLEGLEMDVEAFDLQWSTGVRVVKGEPQNG